MKKLSAILFVALLANTAYIAAFASPTIFYMANVLLHLVLGSVVFFAALRYLPRPLQLLAALVVASGAWLVWAGAVTANQKILWAHMVVGVTAAVWGLYLYRRSLAPWALAPAVALLVAPFVPEAATRIRNPKVAPISMQAEGGGP